MAEPLTTWEQESIEALESGKAFRTVCFDVFRYRDGWTVMWNNLHRNAGISKDLGRFFDEDHIWELRNFMAGKWDRGVRIPCPTID